QPRVDDDVDGAAKQTTVGEQSDLHHYPRLIPGGLMADKLFGGVDGRQSTAATAAAPASAHQSLRHSNSNPLLPSHAPVMDDHSLHSQQQHRQQQQQQQQQQQLQQLELQLQLQQGLLQQSTAPPLLPTAYNNGMDNSTHNAALLLAPWTTNQAWCCPTPVTGVPSTANLPTAVTGVAAAAETVPPMHQTTENLHAPLNLGVLDASAATAAAGIGLGLGMPMGEVGGNFSPTTQQQQVCLEHHLRVMAAAAAARAGEGGAGTREPSNWW
ncbi:unnamed protein product, partial [Sphacelaria rigidula]